MSVEPVILVTGASRGIGHAAVELLLNGTEKFGKARVVALQRTLPEPLVELAARSDGNLALVQGDVTNPEDNARAVSTALDRWGHIDALILNAGIIIEERIADSNLERFAHVLNVNTVSLIATLKAALPALRASKGRVVMVSSGAATGRTSAWSAYNASKAALNAIARTLANEEPEIAVFSVRPGVVYTEMQTEIRAGTAMSAEEKEKFLSLHREGKLLAPRLPAHVIAALAMNGTRESPVMPDGTGMGATGGFLYWDVEQLADFRE
ncbi:hypothetical protein MCUN1_003617 [Malassezia cuniculi]|uniref:Ketoreductase domain-containing protein n=1 Tax=Malassezia cuniculi TaxID=948313 RepID=A0AAF0ETY0_9BASI|nr:hypothetical protein MCUN1_003617 [Malassezia cuniculi]